MKLKTQLVAFFSLLIILLMGGLLFYLNNYLKNYLTNQTIDEFQMLTGVNKIAYLSFVQTLKTRTVDWTSDLKVRASVEQFLTDKSAESMRELNALLKEKMIYDPSVVIAEVLDKNGIVISSSRDDRIGVDEAAEEQEFGAIRFREAIKSRIGEAFVKSMILESDEHPGPMIHITARFFSIKESPAQQKLPLDAVLLLHMVVVDELTNILTGRETGLNADAIKPQTFLERYETGDIYLVNDKGLLLTPARFLENSVLKQEIATLPVKVCFESGKGVFDEYVNYAGRPVFGASSCLKEEGVVLLVEAETEEIFDLLRRIRYVFGLSGFFVLVMGIAGSILFGFWLLNGVNELVRVAREISQNRFGVRASVKSRNEIGYLAGVFNSMLDAVAQGREELKLTVLQLQESNRKLDAISAEQKTILRSVGDGLFAIDRGWNIIHWNPAASDISGWSHEEVIGKPMRQFLKFVRERDKKENIVFIEETMLFGKIRRMENSTILIAKDGREIPVADSAAPIVNSAGQVAGAVIIFRDVTQENEARMLRSDFAYASHQLRTPVTEALYSLEVAISSKELPVKEESLQIAYRSAQTLSKLVEEIISVSEIDQGMIVPKQQSVRLFNLLEETAAVVMPKAKEKEIAVFVSPISTGLEIATDAALLKKALFEILDNAMDFSASKSEVIIKARVEGDLVLIEIQDFGIGIPREQQSLVFTKFFRGSNVPPEIIGAGLGLYIARGYLKLLNGKIWFKSEEGRGTTFSISLPTV